MRYQPIDKNLFVQNRQAFAKRLKPNSIAVFQSNDTMPTNADGNHGFVQNSDLFYLSGIDQEDTILIIFPDAGEDKHREILFIRETNEHLTIWEGPQYSKEEAKSISGIEHVVRTSQFRNYFRPLVVEAENIYLATNEHLRAENNVTTRHLKFIQACQAEFPLHQYHRSSPIMQDLRTVKSEIEISLIKSACQITEKAFRRLLKFIKPDVWEYEIEAEIIHEFLKNRSQRAAYAPIVASGPNSCILHYIKNHHKCRSGELVLMDFGAEYANYASDLTRTVPVNGRFTKRQKAVYNAVLRIQQAAIRMLRPGTTFDAYNHEVSKIIESELIGLGLLDKNAIKNQSADNPLYKKYCMHGISHHLGLDVHDVGSKYRQFEAGMVLTCEPGLYLKNENIGIRIENDILITEAEPLDLTATVPIEADEIEVLMQEHSKSAFINQEKNI